MPAWVSAIRGSVCSVAVSGGGHGSAGLPGAQRPPSRVLGQQEAQGGGPGAGQAEPEQRGHDLLVVDLGVLGVPLLDLEAVDQVADDLVAHGAHAHLVERRLVLQRSDQDLEALAPRVLAEVVRSGTFARGVDQLVDVHVFLLCWRFRAHITGRTDRSTPE